MKGTKESSKGSDVTTVKKDKTRKARKQENQAPVIEEVQPEVVAENTHKKSKKKEADNEVVGSKPSSSEITEAKQTVDNSVHASSDSDAKVSKKEKKKKAKASNDAEHSESKEIIDENVANDFYIPGAIAASIFGTQPSSESQSKGKKKSTSVQDDDLFSAVKVGAIKATKRDFAAAEKATNQPTKKHKKQSKNHDNAEDESDDDDEKEPESSEAKDERDERTIFVGNVPVKPLGEPVEDAKPINILKKVEKELKKKFSEYGIVESVRLRSLGLKSIKVPSGSDYHVVRKAAVAKGSLDERIDTCNAFIVFKEASMVAKAVEDSDGSEFHGHHLRVDAVRDSSKGKVFDRKRTVYVGNLVFEASEEECRKHCASILGDEAIKSVRIIRDATTNLGRGFGYVLLQEESLVEEAVRRLNDTKVRGRPLRVTKCERPDSKKREKLETKFAPVKRVRPTSSSFRGLMATDPTEAPVPQRRKDSTVAQRAASKTKKKSRK